ncbi:MAG: alpha-glutamyl/putrescinyl thymine pyrophosphorylase clade 3 protein [Solirubrobacteraceae bacterium]
MPTFCRHGRFLERCPICSKTLPGAASEAGSSRARSPRARTAGAVARKRGGVVVRREGRAEDDGYRSDLVPGIRASADALKLVEEISFASGRLLALAAEPTGLYAQARALAGEDIERATWTCFLIAYLSPLDGDQPFAGIEAALELAPAPVGEDRSLDLGAIALGPRTSHDPARGADTLRAYTQWVERTAGGSQRTALTGDGGWSPERRFERLFERLALPGFGRVGRYELLVTIGRLDLYELRPDSLHLAGGRGAAGDDPTTVAAKRVFGIGDQLLLDRRAGALADAADVPVEALDLALANWAAAQRATVGFPGETHDDGAYERAGAALGL